MFLSKLHWAPRIGFLLWQSSRKKNVGINCTQTKFQGSFKKVSLINLRLNPRGRKMSDDFGSLVTATVALHTPQKLKNHVLLWGWRLDLTESWPPSHPEEQDEKRGRNEADYTHSADRAPLGWWPPSHQKVPNTAGNKCRSPLMR